jgi:transposase
MDSERRVALEVKAMTRQQIIEKALRGELSWIEAATILGLSARHVYRLRLQYEQFGVPGLRDRRSGRRMPQRIPDETVEELCRLRRERYPDFSIRHFHEFATERHGLKLSYTMTKTVLQARGLAERCPARGQYRRRRERRPMIGMMLHLDASTHPWLEGLPPRDLNVVLDDADGRILFARFFKQEGTYSTLVSLKTVIARHGRFCELYTDRGSHFCYTPKASEASAEAPHHQIVRVLRTLGIRQILARSPEARGRSERAFGTIQGRLPQELKAAGITDYAAANRYLEETFVPDFNRRFSVTPAQDGSAFVRMAGIDLELVFSIQHPRVVANDSTVRFGKLILQLPPGKDRMHYVRCPVVVHQFLDGTLGVSFQSRLLARFTGDAEFLTLPQRAAVAGR